MIRKFRDWVKALFAQEIRPPWVALAGGVRGFQSMLEWIAKSASPSRAHTW